MLVNCTPLYKNMDDFEQKMLQFIKNIIFYCLINKGL